MSTAAVAAAVAAAAVKYAPGDVARVKDYKENVTITAVISTSSPIGYSGVYTAYYQGRPVEMTLSWIPQGLIEARL
jgi:hypothetical protein